MKALIVVDMQNDFMPGGALGIEGALALVPIINDLMDEFSLVIAAQDWHPKSHVSFAQNHPGKHVGDTIEVMGKEQVLWPVHCVQESKGADFVKGLNLKKVAKVIQKGTDPTVDSYSVFYDQAKVRDTGLHAFLKEKGVVELYFAGVATEYCVFYSCIDALELGYNVRLVREGCLGIEVHGGDVQHALVKLEQKGVKVV